MHTVTSVGKVVEYACCIAGNLCAIDIIDAILSVGDIGLTGYARCNGTTTCIAECDAGRYIGYQFPPGKATCNNGARTSIGYVYAIWTIVKIIKHTCCIAGYYYIIGIT